MQRVGLPRGREGDREEGRGEEEGKKRSGGRRFDTKLDYNFGRYFAEVKEQK